MVIPVAVFIMVYVICSPDSCYYWGVKNYNIGSYKDAASNFRKAILGEKARFWKNHRELPGYYNYLALSYANLGEYDNAVNQYENALDAYAKYDAGAVGSVAIINAQIAIIYSLQGNDDELIYYGSQAAEYYRNIGATSEIPEVSTIYLWLANAYYNTHQYELASEYFEVGIPLFYDTVNWGLGSNVSVKIIAVSYKIAALTNEKLGNIEQYEYYNEMYEDFVWLHSLTSMELDELCDEFHWNKEQIN